MWPARYRVKFDDRQKSYSHLASARLAVGATRSGLPGRRSQRRPVPTTPGAGTGPASDGTIHPALTDEALAPGPAASITVTSQPFQASSSAVHRPITPAPITVTQRGRLSPALAVMRRPGRLPPPREV